MRRAFPKAQVDGWADRLTWVPGEVDAGDRHVVAAALAAEAKIIVTINDKHFAPAVLQARFGIEIKDPDSLLVDQWTMAPRQVASGIRRQIARLGREPEAHIEAVRRRSPKFAELMDTDFEVVRES